MRLERSNDEGTGPAGDTAAAHPPRPPPHIIRGSPNGQQTGRLRAQGRRRARATPLGRRVRWTKAKRKQFLVHLSRTANVSASVRKAGMKRKSVYSLRDRDPGFRADWQVALTEAYDNLELQLLDEALNGQERVIRSADGERTVICRDNGMRLRLLAQHRAAVRGRPPVVPLIERANAMRERMKKDLALIAERLGVDPVRPADEDPDEVAPNGDAPARTVEVAAG